MADKKQNQSQIEKLIEMANQLEKREHALTRESSQLEQLRAELDERERKLAAAQQSKPESTFQERAAAPSPGYGEPAFRERPPAAPPSVSSPPPRASQSKQPSVSSETVTELVDILTSVFWDYSNSVHQISSQMSTVTAAMMCAAVTCVLENRGFDAKDVFMQEMDRMLKGGGLGEASADPAQRGRSVAPQPAPPPMFQYAAQPAPRPAPQSAPPPASRYAAQPAPPPQTYAMPAEPRYTPQPAPPQYTPQHAPAPASQILDADDDDDDVYTAVEGTGVPQSTEDGVLHIETASDFQKLGEYGFRNDEKIVRVDLPEGVRHLPGSFFYGCSKLEEVWLPDSIQEIGPYAFYGCEALRVVHLSENSSLREIGEYAFAMCGALQAFDVPAMVEMLGTSVFRFCSSLERLTFSRNSQLQSIGSHLLQNCTSLVKLRLPDSISVIPTSMFYGCSALEKLVAKGVDTIEDYAFYGNESLRTVRIRAKKMIAPQAFEGCNAALEIEYLNY